MGNSTITRGSRPARRKLAASLPAASTSLADALFTTTQQRVLALLFGQPARSFYASELIERTGSGSGAVQRELKRLASSGLVTVKRIGNPVPPPEGASYSISDHPHLQGGLSLELFEAFRVAVLALDECVTEEFLELYVAYKAESNLVDVVPQAKGLRLALNLNFPEIDDPSGVCRDVTNLGIWGNGNVEVRLEKPEDLTYVMGLVRQALEKQLGEEKTD